MLRTYETTNDQEAALAIQAKASGQDVDTFLQTWVSASLDQIVSAVVREIESETSLSDLVAQRDKQVAANDIQAQQDQIQAQAVKP